ncbi:hypothetical protein D3C86_1443120 [compost metagenome]
MGAGPNQCVINPTGDFLVEVLLIDEELLDDISHLGCECCFFAVDLATEDQCGRR